MKQLLLLSLFFSTLNLFTQNKTEAYIAKYSSAAIAEMNMYGIPASITLAQGILESGNGESRLAVEGKNHFGIKCHSNWSGKTIIEDDDEKGECFRKYSKVADSYRDHSLFLTERGRYSFLFDYSRTDYKKWAKGLKKAGYATNPKYANLLIDLIERYNLNQFDTPEKNVGDWQLVHTYGFPFLYGVGVSYQKRDNLFALSLQSSFIINGAQLSYDRKLYNKWYAGLSFNTIYHSFTTNKTNKLDYGLTPHVAYKLEGEKTMLITGGALFTFNEINKQKIIPSVGITYFLR